MNFKRIGIDLAKNVFQLHGVNEKEETVLKKKLKRHQFLHYLLTKVNTNCVIAMEACSGSNHWGRKLESAGFIVRIIPAQYVKPYVKRNKNDANDAEAICEAASRPNMHFVPVKTIEQQDMQAIHRARSELVKQRTMKANQIRGLVSEYGVVAPKGLSQLKKVLPDWLEDPSNELSALFRELLSDLYHHFKTLDEQVKSYETQIKKLASQSKEANRLQTIPGIGPLTATALVAAVGDGKQFKQGRSLAAWLGLTPRQHSSGGKEVLLGITKAGDKYLRTLFIHGARAVVNSCKKKEDSTSQWANNLKDHNHTNKVAVALANKNARVAWAILTKGIIFDANHVHSF